MYDRLTKGDIEKMEREIEERKLKLRPELIEAVNSGVKAKARPTLSVECPAITAQIGVCWLAKVRAHITADTAITPGTSSGRGLDDLRHPGHPVTPPDHELGHDEHALRGRRVRERERAEGDEARRGRIVSRHREPTKRDRKEKD